MMKTTPSTPDTDENHIARQLLGERISVQDGIVTANGTSARIRTWQPPITIDQVTALRQLHLAVPDDATWLPRPIGGSDRTILSGGLVFDACTATSGLPLNRHGEFNLPGHGVVNLPLHETADHGDILVEAGRVLALVHEATRDHAALATMTPSTVHGVHRGVLARWQVARKRLGARAASLPEIRRWLRCGNRVIAVAGERIAEASDVAGDRSVLVHGNVWPAYLHVDDPSRPTALLGLTGWGHASAGSPVIDLAQLCVRVTGWSVGTTESVLGAYSDHARLQPAARRLVPVVAAIDLLDQVGRLLELAWLHDDIANDPAQPFIRGGIKVLLRSLEQLTNVLAPPDPVQRRFHGGSRSHGARGAAAQPLSAPPRPGGGQSRRGSTRRRRRSG